MKKLALARPNFKRKLYGNVKSVTKITQMKKKLVGIARLEETAQKRKRLRQGNVDNPSQITSNTNNLNDGLYLNPKIIPAISQRYKDAYLVANTVTRFGAILKILGIIGGILIGFIGFLAADMVNRNFFFIFVIFVLLGCFIIALFWVFGVLVSAQGQTLKASLDSAVNNSPFLTNLQRARIMSLPTT